MHERGGELHRCTGVQDGVTADQTNQLIYTLEFRMTSDREHGDIQQCDERAKEQYASLLQLSEELWQAKDGKYRCKKRAGDFPFSDPSHLCYFAFAVEYYCNIMGHPHQLASSEGESERLFSIIGRVFPSLRHNMTGDVLKSSLSS